MSIMFSAIFILLALLTMQTTMTRLVDTQRIQIGTMKALGFKRQPDTAALCGLWA